MSTDSTELTFVRCPSCRSLVPAVSTRCRMCGASLDATSQSEDETPQKSGRVRQHTLSTQVNKDLAEMTDQIRENANEAADSEMFGKESSEEIPVEDPLSAYIEEVEVSGDDAKEDDEVNDEELFADLDEGDTSGTLHGLADDPVIEGLVNGNGAAEVEAKESTEDATEETADEQQASDESEDAEEEGSGKKRRRRRRRKKKSESLKQAVDDAPEEPEVKDLDPFVAKGKASQQEEAELQAKDDSAADEKGSKGKKAKDSKSEDSSSEAEENNDSKEAKEDAADSKEEEKESKKQKRSYTATPGVDAAEGRLYGWLVSYADGDGTSIELRESRFFVTRDSLKGNDLILNDDSISTPHAMVTLCSQAGFSVQDLMSEGGVHLKRKGQKKYARVTDPEQIENGDWIRFGELEYLVALVPHPGVK